MNRPLNVWSRILYIKRLKWPVDSIGMYFICKVEGELLETGDETTNIGWRTVEEVYERMIDDPRQFSK